MADLREEVVRRVRQNMHDLALEHGWGDQTPIVVEETADGVVVRVTGGERKSKGSKRSARQQLEESYGPGAKVNVSDDQLNVTTPPAGSYSPRTEVGEEENDAEE